MVFPALNVVCGLSRIDRKKYFSILVSHPFATALRFPAFFAVHTFNRSASAYIKGQCPRRTPNYKVVNRGPAVKRDLRNLPNLKAVYRSTSRQRSRVSRARQAAGHKADFSVRAYQQTTTSTTSGLSS